MINWLSCGSSSSPTLAVTPSQRLGLPLVLFGIWESFCLESEFSALPEVPFPSVLLHAKLLSPHLYLTCSAMNSFCLEISINTLEDVQSVSLPRSWTPPSLELDPE